MYLSEIFSVEKYFSLSPVINPLFKIATSLRRLELFVIFFNIEILSLFINTFQIYPDKL